MYERVRRSRKAEFIVSNPETVKVFCLDNYFKGESIPTERLGNMRAYLLKTYQECKFAKLYRTGHKNYTLHIHSNLWYELTHWQAVV